MNIKSIWSIVVAAGVAQFVTSCGVQIQMETTVPAAVNLGKGTIIDIRLASGTSEPDRHEYGIFSAMHDQIQSDGYYRLEECPHPSKNYVVMDVSDYGINRKEHYADFISRVVVRNKYGQCLYNTTWNTYANRDSNGNYDWNSAYRKVATSTMLELTPHGVTYYERVSGDDENPSVEEGAQACRQGNWASARAYAEQALKTNPNDPEANYLMGLIERYYKNYQASTACFEKAYSINQKSKYRKAIEKNSTLSRNEEIARQQLNN